MYHQRFTRRQDRGGGLLLQTAAFWRVMEWPCPAVLSLLSPTKPPPPACNPPSTTGAGVGTERRIAEKQRCLASDGLAPSCSFFTPNQTTTTSLQPISLLMLQVGASLYMGEIKSPAADRAFLDCSRRCCSISSGTWTIGHRNAHTSWRPSTGRGQVFFLAKRVSSGVSHNTTLLVDVSRTENIYCSETHHAKTDPHRSLSCVAAS